MIASRDPKPARSSIFTQIRKQQVSTSHWNASVNQTNKQRKAQATSRYIASYIRSNRTMTIERIVNDLWTWVIQRKLKQNRRRAQIN